MLCDTKKTKLSSEIIFLLNCKTFNIDFLKEKTMLTNHVFLDCVGERSLMYCFALVIKMIDYIDEY